MPSTSAVSKVRLVCKSVELILACVCIGLYANGSKINLQQIILLPVTFGGYIIIVTGLLLGFVTGEKVPKKIDLLYMFTGMVLFISAGSFHIHLTRGSYHNFNINAINTATGSISIINGVVFLVDIVLAYRDVNEYTPH